MKKGYAYIITSIILFGIIVVLTLNLVNLNSTVKNIYCISYDRYYDQLRTIDQTPIKDKESLDIKHIQDIKIEIIKAIESGQTIDMIADNTHMHFISRDINSLICEIENSYNTNESFNQLDYEKYLKVREYISKIRVILERDNFMLNNLNNKTAKELQISVFELESKLRE